MDRVVVAFASEDAQRRIARLLESDGCLPAGCCCAGAEVIRTVRKLGSAVVICGFKLRDMTANDLAYTLRQTAVVLAVTTPVYLDLCEGENLYKLATPISRSAFFASLDMLLQVEERELHPSALRRTENETRQINWAKSILMDVNRMTESEAHRFIQKRSMDTGLRMAETAQFIIESHSR